ncbi:MAG: hypothetical protein HC882_04300 [Acidobacteria bacterium]|nr:hypothetical protein [Acidobacteriota bacterium]
MCVNPLLSRSMRPPRIDPDDSCHAWEPLLADDELERRADEVVDELTARRDLDDAPIEGVRRHPPGWRGRKSPGEGDPPPGP